MVEVRPTVYGKTAPSESEKAPTVNLPPISPKSYARAAQRLEPVIQIVTNRMTKPWCELWSTLIFRTSSDLLGEIIDSLENLFELITAMNAISDASVKELKSRR